MNTKNCKYCGKEMRRDGVRITTFKGNYDVYWICDNCLTRCRQKVRYNKFYKEYWIDEHDKNK